MRARAPGKLVLSGAYAVLRGAPALVTAVDRYVIADSSRPSTIESREVTSALDRLERERGTRPAAPFFDASALRDEDRKIGLGSSAAIVSACVAVLLADDSHIDLPSRVFEIALAAHRMAQGGGSGIDVAAACFGGTLLARRSEEQLEHVAVALPNELVVEVWAIAQPASTAEFVARVFALEKGSPALFARLLGAQTEASENAARALSDGQTDEFVAMLALQLGALTRLGDEANVPIVLPSVRELARLSPSRSVFLPAGAGGGDVTVYFGCAPSPTGFRTRAAELGYRLLELAVDAPGLSLEPASPLS